MKQTAVESIIEKINNVKPTEFCSIETIKKWCIEAKAMEKEQIMHAYGQGVADEAGEILDATKDSEEYYDKKYGGEK
jgi:hypothetical protein